MSQPNSSKQHLLRFTMLVHRRKGMSEDEFHTYWRTKHQSIVKNWLIKHGCIRYTQYHLPSSLRQTISSSSSVFSSMPHGDFDGAAEFHVREGDFDFWDRAKADPYYESVVRKDEEKFFDAESVVMLVGREEVYIDDGEIAEMG